ncbi:MAG: serine/threonine-protein kinase [Leptolyngbyaceae cyanobacterium bins.349]|nr:serine/threonine-protein kinase [Leptolyngbyaceae cyanobacterium bins.349]
MSYCLNPDCPHPTNPNHAERCQQCSEVLQLQNRYLALKPIGQGGFGRTFLAIDTSRPLKPRCVIKQFLPQQQDPNSLEKAAELFQQEAQRLEELGEHPQIPTLLAYLEQNGRQYLVQEFIDGQNLAQELEADGIFNEAKIRQLLNDLLPMLQYIHWHQVIHRDIKPTNIIRRATDKKLFLVDLGAAKYATGTALAITGTVIGSAEYTAPEQSRGKAIFASDLYSLGATCVHLLTGLSPFDLYDSSEGRWVWRDYVPSLISESLSRILDKMLEGPTNRRYQLVNEILIDLNFSPLDQESASNASTRDNSYDSLQQLNCADYALEALEFEDRPALANVSLEAGGNLAAAEQGGELQEPALTEASPELIEQGARIFVAMVVGLMTLGLLTFGFIMLHLVMIMMRSPRYFPPTPPFSAPTVDQPSSPAFTPRTVLTNPVQPIQTLTAAGQVFSLAISPDSKLLVSGNNDSRVSDASGTATGYHDSNLQVWDLTTGKVLHTMTSRYPVRSVAISPDNQTLASQSVNIATYPVTPETVVLDDNGYHHLRGTLQLWNLQTGKLRQTLAENTYALGLDSSIAFSPDGKFLAGSSAPDRTDIWNVATGNKVGILQPNPDSSGLSMTGPVRFGLDNTTLFIAPMMRTSSLPPIERWNWLLSQRTEQLQVRTPPCNGSGRCGNLRFAISQKNQMLVSSYLANGFWSGTGSVIETWQLQTGAAKYVSSLYVDGAEIESIAISPDGNLIATAGTQNSVGTVDIYTAQSKRLLSSLSGSSKQAMSVVFTPDGKKLITGNLDGTIRVWSVEQLVPPIVN